jgi:hypothetical protein
MRVAGLQARFEQFKVRKGSGSTKQPVDSATIARSVGISSAMQIGTWARVVCAIVQ